MTDNNNNTEGQKPSALTESAKPSILDFGQPDKEQSIIKVIGVGGGGGNAVNHMYREGIHDVSFVLCNTDAQALNDSPVPEHLQLGAEGLGAGNRPERARQAAMESIDQIRAMLNDGTKMAFITAGMGGGTGTGAAPVIAQVSKEMGILTVGIVTIPFRFEGPKKIDQALDGVEEMAKHVDALLVINNERLREIYPELTVLDAFGKADDTLSVAAKSIAEIITIHGLINLDFNDVKTVLKDGGVAIMSTGYGEGDGRVKKAIDDALNSPLLNDNDVFNSKKILLSIAFSNEKNDNQGLMMEEMNDVNDFMAKFGDDFEIKWGLATDPELGGAQGPPRAPHTRGSQPHRTGRGNRSRKGRPPQPLLWQGRQEPDDEAPSSRLHLHTRHTRQRGCHSRCGEHAYLQAYTTDARRHPQHWFRP